MRVVTKLGALFLGGVVGCVAGIADVDDELGEKSGAYPGPHKDGTAAVCGGLALANTATEYDLDKGPVNLAPAGAAAIVKHRKGPDGVEGTDDDQIFDDLEELWQLKGI